MSWYTLAMIGAGLFFGVSIPIVTVGSFFGIREMWRDGEKRLAIGTAAIAAAIATGGALYWIGTWMDTP